MDVVQPQGGSLRDDHPPINDDSGIQRQVPSSSLYSKSRFLCTYDGKTNAVCTLVRNETGGALEAQFGVTPVGAFLRCPGQPVKQLPCVSAIGKIPHVAIIKRGEDLFCFAGNMHGQGAILLWYNGVPVTITTDESTGQGTSVKGRLRGFGDACLLPGESSNESNNKVYFRIATGLGVRSFSILKLEITLGGEAPSGVLRLERFVQCGNFDTHALQFNENGTILGICQWLDGGKKLRTLSTLEPKASMSPALSEDQLEAQLGKHERESLLNKFSALSNTAQWDSAYLEYTDLFPKRVLDPEAYDGEVNEDGEPHGYGVQLVGGGRRVYKGYWRNGLCHGKGSLFDETEQTLLFEGYFKNGKKEGPGYEVKPGKETFKGNFQGDMRNGYGELTLLTQQKVASVDFAAGVVIKGFFAQNKLHGLARICYPPGSLGNVQYCSIGAFAHNMCQGEFWFYLLKEHETFSQLDSCPKLPPPLAFKLLGNSVPLLAAAFKFESDPRCCWVCLEEASGSCKTCATCGFLCHSSKCASLSDCPFDGTPLSVSNQKASSTTTAKKPRVSGAGGFTTAEAKKSMSVDEIREEAIQEAMEDMTKIRGKMLEHRRQVQLIQVREELAERKKLRLEKDALEKNIAELEQINQNLAKEKASLINDLDLSANLLVMDLDQLEAYRKSLLKLLWSKVNDFNASLNKLDEPSTS